MSTVGKFGFVNSISLGNDYAQNFAKNIDPQTGTRSISSTAVPESSGTRTDPFMWGLSNSGDFVLTWGDENPANPSGNYVLEMDPQVSANSSGTVFVETPLFNYNRLSLSDPSTNKLFAALEAYCDNAGAYDVIAVNYNSSFVLQAKVQLAGGFEPFSSATPKSAALSAALNKFLACFEGNSNGGNGGSYYALRFRFLSGSNNAYLARAYVSDVPYRASGVYVPTYSNGSNLTLQQSPASRVQWSVVGDFVTMSGLSYLNYTSGLGTIDMSLPLTTKFTSDISNADASSNKDEQGAGSMICRVNFGIGASRCLINTGVVNWQVVASGSTTNFFTWTFGYRLVNPGT